RAAARPALKEEGRSEAERPARAREAADRDRTRGEEGAGPGRARALEVASSASRRPSPAGRRSGRRDARALLDLDSRTREPRARSGGAPTGAGASRCRLRPARYVAAVRKISASSAGGVTSSWS